jgi:hypothetical protein
VSKLSERRELQQQIDSLPPAEIRILTTTSKHTKRLLIAALFPLSLDLLKEWASGRVVEFFFDHLGIIGINLFRYKFAFLTLFLAVCLLWLVYVAFREGVIKKESVIRDLHGEPYTFQHVSLPWAMGFASFVLASLVVVGYGCYDYYKTADLLREFPLGYVIFDMDTVTGAVTPLEMRRGLEVYQFDFRPVKVIENSANRFRASMPEIYKDHKLLLSGGEIGGDKATMQAFSAGMMFQDGNDGVLVHGRALHYDGDRLTWVIGFTRFHNALPS